MRGVHSGIVVEPEEEHWHGDRQLCQPGREQPGPLGRAFPPPGPARGHVGVLAVDPGRDGLLPGDGPSPPFLTRVKRLRNTPAGFI